MRGTALESHTILSCIIISLLTCAGEDAEEEQIDSEKFQELYSGVEFKDPKKTLRGYYEREGIGNLLARKHFI